MLSRRRPSVSFVAIPLLLMSSLVASAADWPMRGGQSSRNAVVPDAKGPTAWRIDDDPTQHKNVKWSAELGTVTCGDPVVSQGLVWVGTNNGQPRDPDRKEDAGVLMCFSEGDGEFLYQYVSPRRGDRRFDWPMSSLSSSPLVEGDRLWFCTNRCEVVCLDIAPLIARTGQPRVVWMLDMRERLVVVPRGVMIGSNVSHCSIAGYKDLIYVNTTNSADYDGKVFASFAPSLICLQKKDGAIRWQDNSPGENILDVQHGNPAVAEIGGKPQVIMGQGDGWLRGFDALTGEVLWKFDINDKLPKPKRGNIWGSKRSDLVPMPVVDNQRVYFTVGRHYEACSGPGRVACLDPTKRGDISADLDDGNGQGKPNPNSGLIWEYRGTKEEPMERTLSSVAIHNGLLITTDFSGRVHCLDVRTGERLWVHDTEFQTCSSPLIVGKMAFVANDWGVQVFKLTREKQPYLSPDSPPIETSPVFANGVLYLTTRTRLFAIGK